MTWKETRLKHLCIDSGQYGLNIAADNYAATGTRLIRTSDITADGSLKDAQSAVHVDAPIEPRHQLLPGDILLSRSGTLGRSFLVPSQAQGHTFAGFLIRFRPKLEVEPRFLYYATQSARFQSTVHAEAVTSTIQNFNADRYANIPMSAPAKEEQRRIADFLDAETARIDQLLALRERQHQLVLLHRDARVRAHFQSVDTSPTRLKFLLAARPRYGVLVPKFEDNGVKFIRVNDLLDLPGRAEALITISPEVSAQYPTTVVRTGDVLVSVVGTLGRSAVAPHSVAGSNVNRAIAVLRPQPQVDRELLTAWINTADFQEQALLATGNDSAQRTLGMEDLANFHLHWPFSESDQRKLASMVQRSTEWSREISEALKRQSVVLKERRQALITAAVTGQFDVSTASGRNVTEGVSA